MFKAFIAIKISGIIQMPVKGMFSSLSYCLLESNFWRYKLTSNKKPTPIF